MTPRHPRPIDGNGKWKWLTLTSTAVATLAVLAQFLGMPSCSDYMTKAEAKDHHRTYESIHKETLELINSNAIAIGVLDERTK